MGDTDALLSNRPYGSEAVVRDWPPDVLFTQVRGKGVARSSRVGGSKKFGKEASARVTMLPLRDAGGVGHLSSSVPKGGWSG